MKRITVSQLKSKNACSSQVKLFEKTFGSSAALTKRNIMKAAEAGLNLAWFAEKFLSPPVWRAYGKLKAPASLTYDGARVSAQRAYGEATALDRWAGGAARAPAERAYDETTAAVWQVYREAAASALWNALKGNNGETK